MANVCKTYTCKLDVAAALWLSMVTKTMRPLQLISVIFTTMNEGEYILCPALGDAKLIRWSLDFPTVLFFNSKI